MKILPVLLIALTLGACATKKPLVEEEFTVDFESPSASLGVTEMQFERLFSIAGLRKAKVSVSYFPLEDAVCLQYRTDTITYYQYWSREGREAFFNALERYNEDYETRNLDRKARKTKTMREYDTVKGYLIWQLARYTVMAKAPVDVELGYSFASKSPYFTINQREAVFVSPMSVGDNRESLIMTMFLTRAQAAELAGWFDQDVLDSIEVPEVIRRNNILERIKDVINKDNLNKDEY